SGHFAVVIELDTIILAAVDLIRTFPLFMIEQEELLLTDHPVSSQEWNEKQIPIFKKIYCTNENETLLKGCFQLQAGEYAVIDKTNNNYEIKSYYRHRGDALNASEPNISALHASAESDMIDRAIQYANNRKII